MICKLGGQASQYRILSGESSLGKGLPGQIWHGQVWRHLGTLLRFSTGQIALQGITAFTGLCLVRWLAVADYAIFGLSLTLQSALGLIVDLGVTSAIMALTGDQYSNGAVLGRYIQAGLHLRSRLLLMGTAVGAGAIYVIGKRQQWPFSTEALVFVIVISGLLSQFWISIYGVPLILNRRLGRYYGILAGAAGFRLASVVVLRWVSVLSAGPALAAGTLASLGAALTLRRWSRDHWEAASRVDPQAREKIIRYISPRAPLVVFQSLARADRVVRGVLFRLAEADGGNRSAGAGWASYSLC